MDFFAELRALQLASPRIGAIQLRSTNSDYTFAVDQAKNCYLIANGVKNEDCMYGRDLYENVDCVDCAHINHCTLCYECLDCKGCYNGNYLQNCHDCTDCAYSYDLRACQNCFGCAGLRKKEFYIFNEPYSKEEYFKKIKELTPAQIEEGFEKVKRQTPRVFSYQMNSENSLGDNIHNSKNAFFAFDVSDCQDIGYVMESKKLTDCYDISILEDSSLCYEISSCHIMYNSNFCYQCVNLSDCEYCEFMNNSKNCFGCIGLNHKEYYILNKPYTPEEYFKKVAEIKADLKAKNLYGREHLPSSYPLKDTVAMWDRM